MNDNPERDARLQQIVEDVKKSWATPKKKVVRVSQKIRKAPQEPLVRVQTMTQEELLPLIEAKKTTREKLLAKYKKCTQCDNKTNLTVEHIVPVAVLKMFGIRRMASLNYEKHKKNLTLLCKTCNHRKGDTVDLADKKVKRILMWYIKNHDSL